MFAKRIIIIIIIIAREYSIYGQFEAVGVIFQCRAGNYIASQRSQQQKNKRGDDVEPTHKSMKIHHNTVCINMIITNGCGTQYERILYGIIEPVGKTVDCGRPQQ